MTFIRTTLATILLLFAVGYAAQVNARDGAIAHYRAGDHERGAQAMNSVVESDAKDRWAWLYLGASLVHLGKSDEASDAFRKFVSLPKDAGLGYERPLKITAKRPAEYTEAAMLCNIKGRVLVAVEFQADGKIGFVVPVTKLKCGLTESALKAARGIRFEPAVQNGTPVTDVRGIELTGFNAKGLANKWGDYKMGTKTYKNDEATVKEWKRKLNISD